MTKTERRKILYCTVSEAAERLKVTRQTVYRWIDGGKIKSEKIGREIVIDRLELHKVMRNLWIEAMRKDISSHVIDTFFWDRELIKGREAEVDQDFSFQIAFEEPFAVKVTDPNGKSVRVMWPLLRIKVTKEGKMSWSFPQAEMWDKYSSKEDINEK
jgi:excisionase family DNA binding protein